MMTRDYAEIYSIPRVPGIYAFHVGASRVKSIAYVGSTGNLRNRVSQHLEYRDSSVTTGASAAVLNPDYIDSCTWWTHPNFADRLGRESAELIAFDVLNIAGYPLKNRGIRSCIPAPVSEKKVLNASSPPPIVLSDGICPSGWIPCSRQYNSQQALPIWTPA